MSPILQLLSARLIEAINPEAQELANMAKQPTREQIIERCQRKMIAALEGRLEIQEVCGLSIESLRTSLAAERDRLLKQYGYADSANPERKVSSELINKKKDR